MDRKKTRANRKKQKRTEEKKLATVEKKLFKSYDLKVHDENLNEEFNAYYRHVLGSLLTTPEHFKAFLTSLSTPLPTTFRLNRRHELSAWHNTKRCEEEFKTFKGKFVSLHGSGKVLTNVCDRLPLDFGSSNAAKDALGWTIHADGGSLAKSASLGSLHSFLAREAKLGHLARQSVASMLPVLCLFEGATNQRVKVLDVCAAPGSKTEQLFDHIHKGSLVVANDSDSKRTCYAS